jgi:hypothetical protein
MEFYGQLGDSHDVTEYVSADRRKHGAGSEEKKSAVKAKECGVGKLEYWESTL